MNRTSFIAAVCFTVLAGIAACDFEPDDNSLAGGDPTPSVLQDISSGMQFYFGNFHSHTAYSGGKGTPAQAFAWARDTAGFDFYLVTDHAELVTGSEWRDTGAQADAFNEDGVFVALRGFEWSNIWYGHMVVFNTNAYASSLWIGFLSSFYAFLDSHEALAQFNHPGRETVTRWNLFHYDERVADNLALVETGNKGDGNSGNKYLPYYHRALDAGWKTAPANNQDNHSLAASPYRTVVVAPDLTREDIVDAVKARRVYSVDDDDMMVVLRYGDAWMGSTIAEEAGVKTLMAAVMDDEPVETLAIISNRGKEVARKKIGCLCPAVWEVSVQALPGSYFYLLVTGTNTDGAGARTQQAVTAPIWFE